MGAVLDQRRGLLGVMRRRRANKRLRRLHIAEEAALSDEEAYCGLFKRGHSYDYNDDDGDERERRSGGGGQAAASIPRGSAAPVPQAHAGSGRVRLGIRHSGPTLLLRDTIQRLLQGYDTNQYAFFPKKSPFKIQIECSQKEYILTDFNQVSYV